MSLRGMELSDFSVFISETVGETLRSEGESGFREAAFTREIMEYMADAHETGNVQVCTAIRRNKIGNRLYQINGYGIWDNYETLDFFITDYKGDGSLYTVTKTDVTANFNLAFRYIEHLFKDNFEAVEDSAAEKEFYDNFINFKESLLRIRVILLTDGLVKKYIPANPIAVGQHTIHTEVWDLERIFQLWSSQRRREPIEIDLRNSFGYKIRCLQTDQPSDNYTAYLCVVPAALLADLYDAYGSRVLEQNVRVYLQSVGKINKDIRKTILERPGMFMAYNNGISATVTGISFEKAEVSGENVIGLLRDLQIVNGAQTISSLYYARKKDGGDLCQINVQMKITLIQDSGRMEKIVAAISRYANSQNKVSESDLTSNLAFNIRMEEVSRTTWAAPVTGNRQTRWYFERVKGQYREEMNREHKESAKKAFKERNPPEQVIRKDELSKFHHAWHQEPFWVARGSQKNYMHFIDKVKNVEPTRQYFQHTVAIAILFKEAEKLYGRKPYAMGDLRYLAVPYSIAWLSFHTGGRIDLGRIWKQQQIPAMLIRAMEIALRKVNDFLQRDKPDMYALVSEWAKKEECWQRLKDITPMKMEVNLDKIKALLVTENETGHGSLMDPANILSVPMEKWEIIESFANQTGKLSPLQKGSVRNIINRLRKQKPLTEQLIVHGAAALAIHANHRKNKK
jgi:hypothetical protein